ncbi:unnamed protein product, partial [Rotaria sp. Silwood1]
MQMDSSSDVKTIALTLLISGAQIRAPNDEKMSCIVKTKIGRHGLEHIVGDLKDKTFATCILCKETLWHVKNSTSNYWRHLQCKHKDEYNLWSKNASDKNKILNKMKQTFCEDSLSSPCHTSITGKPAFIQAMKTVDPKFRIPSRWSITSDYLPKLHGQIINKLNNACSSADFLSLTFDGWTDHRMQAFYAVTMHYINQTGQLKAHLLAFNLLS